VPVIENILPHLGLQARVPPRARGKMTGSFAAWNQCWRRSATGVRREKAALFQWVQAPPGEMLQPEATGAVMEVTM
jgi:hypothetical protein